MPRRDRAETLRARRRVRAEPPLSAAELAPLLGAPPGISGLWQVSGRSELSFDEYVRLDLFYIENWSLAYDLFILAKTIPMILARKGAY